MKKILLVLLACICFLHADARKGPDRFMYADSLIPRWCIDINAKAGMLTQTLTTINMTSAFQNVLNDTVGKLKFSNGTSYGFDVQVGYFFGKKRHFGIGTGFMYLSQKGDLTLDQYRLEYQSSDSLNNTFRQIVTANNPIKESVTITNLNIPLLLKYKTQFSPHWGLTVDAGLLFNVQMKNAYTTNASFDYEAIYKIAPNGTTSVYDNAVVPDAHDEFITKAEFKQDNPAGNINTYFDQQYKSGHNVGLAQIPKSASGTVTYKASIGFLVQPSVTFRLSDYFFLNLGAYYMMHSFDNSGNNTNYMLTNKVGDYSSVMNAVSKSQNTSYGLNLGLRIFIDKDIFGDRSSGKHGRRKKDKLADEILPPVENKNPVVKTDDKPARKIYTELPVKAVHFDIDKDLVTPESAAKLDQVADFMKDNPAVLLTISGFADNSGVENKNITLSKDRAQAVKLYLESKGVDSKRMTAEGKGSKDPVASNKTANGRAENRRVVLQVKGDK